MAAGEIRRYWKKLAILADLEVTYAGTTALTGAANAMQVSEATLTYAGGEVSRELLLPFYGHQGVILINDHATLQFSVEIAGSGTPGTVPAWGKLMRMCRRAEVIDTTAGSANVKYSPISSNFESGGIYFNRDGVKQVLVGARGNCSFSLAPGGIPRFTFNFTGLLGELADEALPTVGLTKFMKPVPVSKNNTSLQLHGWNATAESLSVDFGNQVEGRFLIGDESIEITDGMMTGSAVVEARKLAVINWVDKARKRERGVLKAVHGTAAGNIIQIDAPAVEIGRPTEGQTQNIANNTLPLMFIPVNGNDELIITVN